MASCDIFGAHRQGARGISIGVKITRRAGLTHQEQLGARRQVDLDVLHTTHMALVRKRTPDVAHDIKQDHCARRRNSTGVSQNLLASFGEHVYLTRIEESRDASTRTELAEAQLAIVCCTTVGLADQKDSEGQI